MATFLCVNRSCDLQQKPLPQTLSGLLASLHELSLPHICPCPSPCPHCPWAHLSEALWPHSLFSHFLSSEAQGPEGWQSVCSFISQVARGMQKRWAGVQDADRSPYGRGLLATFPGWGASRMFAHWSTSQRTVTASPALVLTSALGGQGCHLISPMKKLRLPGASDLPRPSSGWRQS